MRVSIQLLLASVILTIALPCSGQTPANDNKGSTPTVVFDPPGTAQRYASQHEREPYQNAKILRDIAYGTRPRNLLDIATPPKASATLRPILIFVPGGPGNRIEVKGYPFYDNVLLWAVTQGYIAINMNRDSGPDTTWDTGAKNIASVIQWAQNNAKDYGGNASQIFVWGHSLGATALATYISHPELYTPKGVGMLGAILFAGSYNIAPLQAMQPGRNPPTNQPAPDPATLLAQSSLPGLQKTTLPLLLAAADGDPLDRPEYISLLNEALCKTGRCPTTLIVKGHDHFSEIFSINTSDQSVSKPVLDWLNGVLKHK